MCRSFGAFDGSDDFVGHFNVSLWEVAGYAPRWEYHANPLNQRKRLRHHRLKNAGSTPPAVFTLEQHQMPTIHSRWRTQLGRKHRNPTLYSAQPKQGFGLVDFGPQARLLTHIDAARRSKAAELPKVQQLIMEQTPPDTSPRHR